MTEKMAVPVHLFSDWPVTGHLTDREQKPPPALLLRWECLNSDEQPYA